MKKHVCEANSKDYSMSFKLQIVQEIERGQLTVTNPQRLMAFKIEQLLLNG
jgi:transposase-like protein